MSFNVVVPTVYVPGMCSLSQAAFTSEQPTAHPARNQRGCSQPAMKCYVLPIRNIYVFGSRQLKRLDVISALYNVRTVMTQVGFHNRKNNITFN